MTLTFLSDRSVEIMIEGAPPTPGIINENMWAIYSAIEGYQQELLRAQRVKERNANAAS